MIWDSSCGGLERDIEKQHGNFELECLKYGSLQRLIQQEQAKIHTDAAELEELRLWFKQLDQAKSDPQ